MKEKKENKILKHLGNLDLYAACLLLTGLIALTFVGVIRRYITRVPITWMEEVQLLLFLWIVFLGGSAAFRSGSHVAIEIVVDALPKKLGGFVERFDVLLQAIILGYLFYQEVVYYNTLVNSGRVTNLLRLPYQLVYFVVPVGGALMIISMLRYAYQKYIVEPKMKKEELEV